MTPEGNDAVIDNLRDQLTSDDLPIWRQRINVSRSVKGVITFDCTVEGTNVELDELLKRHDDLVYELQERYPDPAESREVQGRTNLG